MEKEYVVTITGTQRERLLEMMKQVQVRIDEAGLFDDLRERVRKAEEIACQIKETSLTKKGKT
jgi:hypothetical protein